jgi:hypothetical protein
MHAIIVAVALLAGLLTAGSVTRSTVCYVEERIESSIEEDEAAARFRLQWLISFDRDGSMLTVTGLRDCEGEE